MQDCAIRPMPAGKRSSMAFSDVLARVSDRAIHSGLVTPRLRSVSSVREFVIFVD